MRFILEKPANFNDIKKVIFNGEELGVDLALHTKFAKPPKEEAISNEDLEKALGEAQGNEDYKAFNLANLKDGDLKYIKRCVLYSLICSLTQYKKVFTLETLNSILEVINQKTDDIAQIDIQDATSLIGLFKGEGEQACALTLKQTNLILAISERVVYSGVSLFIYFLNLNLSNIIVADFAVYLEAVGCDLKFLDDVIKMNIENRALINDLGRIEKFFYKRNNKKGKGNPEMLETCLALLQVKRDLKELKFGIKDFFGAEFNPSLKKTYSETRFLSKIWKSVGFGLQKLTLTLITLVPQLSRRALNLVETYYGKEQQVGLFKELEANNCSDVIISTQIGYVGQLANALNSSIAYRNVIGLEVGACRSIILDRLFKDKHDPKRKKKKKAGFKLGEGSIQVLETLFYNETLDSHLEVEAAETEEITEGGEQQEQVAPTKEFAIEATQINYANQAHQEVLNTIFNQILETKRRPKVAKGVRDATPLQMCIKNLASDHIKEVFRKHGGSEIDTPVFELKETLMGKYGEEGGKLIYDLKDQGGELLSLRYDLTVPFARYCSTHTVQKMKRFHFAKVWRRDQPNMNKGRFREFHQCDLDLAMPSGPMIADSELLSIANEILTGLGIENFELIISDRRILEAIIQIVGAPLERFKTICSSIDKLDKEPWDRVADELINDKGIDAEVVGKLENIVQQRGSIDDLVQKIEEAGTFGDNTLAKIVFDEFKLLSGYLKSMGAYENVVFDLSMARGLDYYTGLIFEIKIKGIEGLGSIGGGGRYDKLIGMFGNKDIPSVGMSFGIERLFVVLEKMHENAAWLRGVSTHILVTSIGKGLAGERIKLISELWKGNLKAEMLYEENQKPKKALNYALENKIPFIIWIGEDEIQNEIATLKCTYDKTETKVARADLVSTLQDMVQQYSRDLEEGNVIFEKPENPNKKGGKKGGKGKK